METSELTGEKLDYWIAKTVGVNVYFDAEIKGKLYLTEGGDSYSPSTNWAQGGPLIEKYNIKIDNHVSDGWVMPTQWRAKMIQMPLKVGETPLLAAMRCLVAGAYGDEVPDE